MAVLQAAQEANPIGDLSAVVTGIILALNVPVGMPLGQLIVGDLVAIVVVKQLFGGIGCNFMNPALVGRAVLLASYATAMTTWAVPMSKLSIFGSNADAVTSSTPLAIMKGGRPGLPDQQLLRWWICSWAASAAPWARFPR